MALEKVHLTRQADIIDSTAIGSLTVAIIGVGGIGSFACLALAKMGCEKISIYDFDSVDEVNMNSQLFRFSDIGKPKVEAVRDIVKDFTGVIPTCYNGKVTKHTNVSADIIVMAVDSMSARSEILDGVKCKYLIDTRMSAEKYSQYTVNMRSTDSVSSYRKTLYTDAESIAERCTAKSTIYTTLTASSMVCKVVKNILAKEPYPKTILMDLNKSEHNVHMFT